MNFLYAGLEKNTDYPYHGHEGTCRHDTDKTVATLSKVRKVQSKNEDDLKRAVHNRGPVGQQTQFEIIQTLVTYIGLNVSACKQKVQGLQEWCV